MKVDLTLLHKRRDEENRVIAAALSRVGVQVDGIFDFTGRRTPKEAIPVLVELLAQEFEPVMKEGIVQALTQRNARKEASGPLLAEFRRVNGDMILKWTIGAILSGPCRQRGAELLESHARPGRVNEVLSSPRNPTWTTQWPSIRTNAVVESRKRTRREDSSRPERRLSFTNPAVKE